PTGPSPANVAGSTCLSTSGASQLSTSSLEAVLLDDALVPLDLDAALARPVQPGHRERPALAGVVEQGVDVHGRDAGRHRDPADRAGDLLAGRRVGDLVVLVAVDPHGPAALGHDLGELGPVGLARRGAVEEVAGVAAGPQDAHGREGRHEVLLLLGVL